MGNPGVPGTIIVLTQSPRKRRDVDSDFSNLTISLPPGQWSNLQKLSDGYASQIQYMVLETIPESTDKASDADIGIFLAQASANDQKDGFDFVYKFQKDSDITCETFTQAVKRLTPSLPQNHKINFYCNKQ